MTAALRFMRLDLRSLRPYLKALGMPAAVMIVAIGLTAEPSALIVAAAMMASLLVPQYLFALDERSRLDTLYAILGISRRDVVTGRHLSVALTGLVAIGLGVVVAIAAAAIRQLPLQTATVMMMVCLGALLFALVSAIATPVSFALGQTRARPAALGVSGALFLAVMLVGWLAPEAFDRLFGALASLALPAILTGLIVLAAALLVGSALASRALYSRRDL